jgi:hypothetical protein
MTNLHLIDLTWYQSFVYLFGLGVILVFVAGILIFARSKKWTGQKVGIFTMGLSLVLLILAFSISYSNYSGEKVQNGTRLTAWADTNYGLQLTNQQAQNLLAGESQGIISHRGKIFLQLKHGNGHYVLLSTGPLEPAEPLASN